MPDAAFDGDESTAWCQLAGNRVGQWIEADIDSAGVELAYVEVGGGWPYDSAKAKQIRRDKGQSEVGDMWRLGNIITHMRISWDDGAGELTFSRERDRGNRKRLPIPSHTKKIHLTVLKTDVSHDGASTVCLDEIRLYGTIVAKN
ncbi:MAG: hypothetical protein U0441_23395 [Polyangiaceae bacterium]